jgi:NAD-dependent dihydropyrimidine dehydrogenase PreA subunit
MKILYCDCAYYDLVEKKKKQEVFSALTSSGMDVVAIPDLCRLAAKERSFLKEISASGNLSVVACYPRAVKALFEFAGVDKKMKLNVLNMRKLSAAEILKKLKVPDSGKSRKVVSGKNKTDKNAWIPWFPVIEYGRCVNCKQCLSFCLFGVYELDKKGKVVVAKPENCKTNCPACAKVCPKSAIIFPKYGESPVNGDEVDENAAATKNLKIDYDKVLGDDTYAILHQRRRNAMAGLLKDHSAPPDSKAKKTRLLKKSK